MKAARCMVTFEYESRPPDTWRGVIKGNTPQAILRRATSTANKKLRPRIWTTLVAVITERLGDKKSDVEEIAQKLASSKKSVRKR